MPGSANLQAEGLRRIRRREMTNGCGESPLEGKAV